MTIAAGSIPQEDTLISPVLSALSVVCSQIENIGQVYTQVPDQAPEDNSVLMAPTEIVVQDNMTNAKLVLDIKLDLYHLFARARLQDNLASIFAAIPAWLTVMTAWSNQTLGGLSQNLNLTDMKIAPYKHANQVYLALIQTVQVRVVWNMITG